MTQGEDDSELHKQIKQSLDDQQYQRALDLCDSIPVADSHCHTYWFYKARALEGLGETRQALEAYRCEIASLKRAPPIYLYNLGRLLEDIGDHAEAAICFGESCRLAPNIDCSVLLASALKSSGHKEQAIETLQKVLEVDPLNDEAWNNLGACLLEDDPLQAERAFRRALEVDPESIGSYVGLGSALNAQRRWLEAIDIAETGLRKRPQEGWLHEVVANGFELLGDLEGAQAAYARMYRCNSTQLTALLGIARILVRCEKIDEAHDWYKRGLRAWPDDEVLRAVYLRFIEIHKEQADPELIAFCQRCADVYYWDLDPGKRE